MVLLLNRGAVIPSPPLFSRREEGPAGVTAVRSEEGRMGQGFDYRVAAMCSSCGRIP